MVDIHVLQALAVCQLDQQLAEVTQQAHTGHSCK